MGWLGRKAEELVGEGRILFLCLRFLVQRPAAALPLAVAWVGSVSLLFHYLPRIPWPRLEWTEALFAIWALAASINVLTLWACSMLLEFLQHIETGRPPRLGRALFDTLVRNSWALLPLASIWAAVEVALWLLEALTTRKNSSSENVIETVFDLLHKGIRMGVFLSLPAIAWEGADPVKAVRRSVSILKSEWPSFLGAAGLSELFIAVVGLPLALGFWLAPDWMWAHFTWVLAAAGVLWTLKIYLEQMMMAELYLLARCRNWDDFTTLHEPVPARREEVAIVPSLFNGIPDLKERGLSG